MPRNPREISPHGVYHFINRGVHKKQLFHSPADYKRFLDLIDEYVRKLEIQIYHYCLMPNHAHFLLKAEEISKLSRLAHSVQRGYAHFYRKIYNWPGQVFQRCFMSKPIHDDAYLLECGRYIERNPLTARLVEQLEIYPYSSYGFYAYGEPNRLVTSTPIYEDFSSNIIERRAAYRLYILQSRPKNNEPESSTLPF